jgi:hypothetical protein
MHQGIVFSHIFSFNNPPVTKLKRHIIVGICSNSTYVATVLINSQLHCNAIDYYQILKSKYHNSNIIQYDSYVDCSILRVYSMNTLSPILNNPTYVLGSIDNNDLLEVRDMLGSSRTITQK